MLGSLIKNRIINSSKIIRKRYTFILNYAGSKHATSNISRNQNKTKHKKECVNPDWKKVNKL